MRVRNRLSLLDSEPVSVPDASATAQPGVLTADRGQQARKRTRIYLLLFALVAGYAAVAALVGPERRGVVASAGLAFGQAGCGLALLLHRHTRPALRRVWRLCGTSALTSSGTFVTWTYYALRYDNLPPALSLADAFFTTSVVLLLVEALLWPGARIRRGERRRYVTDGSVLACSLLLLSWSLVIAPSMSGSTGDRSWQVLVPLLYPVLDVLAVAAMVYAVGAAVAGTRTSAWYLLCGITVVSVGDAVFSLEVSTGTWNYSVITMAMWLLAFAVLVAGRFAAETHLVTSIVPEPDLRVTRASVVFPVVPVFVALLLAIATPSNLGTIILGSALLVLVLVRYTLLGLSDRRIVQDLQGDVIAESAFLQVTLQHLADPVLACDASGRVRFFNAAFAAQRPHARVGADLATLTDPDRMFQGDGVNPLPLQDLPLVRALAGETIFDELVVDDDGHIRRTFHTYACPILGVADEVLGAVLVKHDVTDEMHTNAELLRRTLTDELTGLGNRAQITDDLQTWLKAWPTARPCAVLLLDLDDFKKINDSLGHRSGDLLLVEVADRIRLTLRAGDRAGRLGGDEFVVFLEDADALGAVTMAERLLMSLEAPVVVGETELTISASVGIAMSDSVGDVTNLLGAADLAMYLAKQRGKGGFAMFEPHMQQVAQTQLSLETDLRRAVRNEELHLVYQPIVDLATGALAGVEALVRWRDDVRGSVSPVDFIPVAERTGLILPLGEWVLREATAQLQRWNEQAPRAGLVVSVNVSTRQLERPGLLTTVDDLLARGLDPAQLILEITETALSLDDYAASEALNALRDRGIHMAVDDFGTGYSSLSRLRASPVSRLKIDRSFVSEILHAGSDVPIIDATVAMAKGLGLGVVAEGIESPAQLRYLRRLGCGHAQGYLLARPLDPDRISAILAGDVPWSDLLGKSRDAWERRQPELSRLFDLAVAADVDAGRPVRPLLDVQPAASGDGTAPGEVWSAAQAAAVTAAEAIAVTAAVEVAAVAAATAKAAVEVASAAAVKAAARADHVAARAALAAVAAATGTTPWTGGNEPDADRAGRATYASTDLVASGGYSAADAVVADVAASQEAVINAATVAAAAAAAKVAVRVAAVAADAATAALEAAAVIGERLAQDISATATAVACAAAHPVRPEATVAVAAAGRGQTRI